MNCSGRSPRDYRAPDTRNRRPNPNYCWRNPDSIRCREYRCRGRRCSESSGDYSEDHDVAKPEQENFDSEGPKTADEAAKKASNTDKATGSNPASDAAFAAKLQ